MRLHPRTTGLGLILWLLTGVLVALSASPALAYKKAVETDRVVMNKLFPKRKRLQLGGKFGFIMNQSYMNTFLAGGELSYFFSEEWGLGVEGLYAINEDKSERSCIETFYNDPNFNAGPECGGKGGFKDDDMNWGPAYVPIRELKYIVTGNLLWNPVYGKQIVLLSATNYFDIFISMGGGIAISDFYPLTTTLPDGSSSRGKYDEDKPREENPGTRNEDYIGVPGRPVPKQETNIVSHFAIGQRFHFLNRFMVTADMKNYTLLGTETGFDNFLVLMGGLAVRF